MSSHSSDIIDVDRLPTVMEELKLRALDDAAAASAANPGAAIPRGMPGSSNQFGSGDKRGASKEKDKASSGDKRGGSRERDKSSSGGDRRAASRDRSASSGGDRRAASRDRSASSGERSKGSSDPGSMAGKLFSAIGRLASTDRAAPQAASESSADF